MTDGGETQSVQRVVCAVCSTEYEDAPGAHRIRRCPKCGSRLIRQSDGRLGAVETAAPPPKAARSRVRVNPHRWRNLYAGAGGVMLALGALCFIASVSINLTATWSGTPFTTLGIAGPIGSLVLGTAGLALLYIGYQSNTAAKTKQERRCFACEYPLPPAHIGRCPECGKLQDRLNRRNGICPGCRRSLRGFYGDACPECGTDVRLVTDGTPPDEPPPE